MLYFYTNQKIKKMPYEHFEEYDIKVTDEIQQRYKQIIENLGEDVNREGLLKTPERA